MNKGVFVLLFLLFSFCGNAFSKESSLMAPEKLNKSEKLSLYREYLAKLVPSFNPASILKQSEDKEPFNLEHLNWFESLEKSMYENIGTRFDADFIFTLTDRGFIKTVDLIDIREDDFDAYKTFLSELLAFKSKPLPEGFSENDKFTLNAKWLYIDSFLDLSDLAENISKINHQNNFSKNYNFFDLENEFKAKLIKPSYIDYPALGEKFEFSIPDKNPKAILKTEVEGFDSKKIFLRSDDLHFEMDRPKLSSEFLIAGAFNGLSKGGLGLAIQSYGISTASFTVLALGGAYLLDKDTENSMELNSGEVVTLRRQRRERT